MVVEHTDEARRRVVCQGCGWTGERFGTGPDVCSGPCPRCWGSRLRQAPVVPTKPRTRPRSFDPSTSKQEAPK